jgi:glutaredoxin/glutathione-dependent peroxiredoxin
MLSSRAFSSKGGSFRQVVRFISVGDNVPKVSGLKVIKGDQKAADTDSESLFKGRKVALFGLPGAFTPVCTSKHVPGFIEKTSAFKEKGYDIVCLSVNDSFVMQAWTDTFPKGHKIEMLCDWNCALSDALKLSADLSGAALGKRAVRFSCLIENGKVKTLNVEKSPADHDVTSATELLKQIK